MVVMSYAFPLFFCTHFFQVVLPETYQECLALVARSGGVDGAEIAQQLHSPPFAGESRPEKTSEMLTANTMLDIRWTLQHR